MRKPHELDERVKKNLNISCNEDLINQKNERPGPGSYEAETSLFDSNRETAKTGIDNGFTIPKNVIERCVFERGKNISPGPGRYDLEKNEQKTTQSNTFNKEKRSIDLSHN